MVRSESFSVDSGTSQFVAPDQPPPRLGGHSGMLDGALDFDPPKCVGCSTSSGNRASHLFLLDVDDQEIDGMLDVEI